MRVTLLTMGETKDKHTLALCRDFETRLDAFCHFEQKALKVCRLPLDPSQGDIERALKEEERTILSALDAMPRACRVALCVEGEELSSEEFSAFLSKKMLETGEFVFLIGSSHGLSDSVKRACHKRVSISRMTLPHELARLFFTEQLYRAFTIANSMKYHK